MTKLDFILALNERLSGLPREEVRERISFYSEMIEDRMEEGLSEEEAVAAVGSVEEIAAQITADISLPKQQAVPKARIKTWEIVLLAVGAPLWLSLLIAALSVVISVYAVLWSLIVSLWAVFAALVGCALGGIAAGIGFAVAGSAGVAMALMGAGLVCGGLSVFAFAGSLAVTRGMIWLTGKAALWVKNRFVRKGEV